MQKYSVALCTYNGAKYIKEQLDSIVNQTIKPAQIIVSDDGSKDETLDIAEKVLSESNIEYIIVHNKENRGVTHNFQNAFSYCANSIIFCSDQDDVWVPQKAEKMLLVYEKHPEAMLVFSDGELVDGDLNLLGCNIWKAIGITPEKISEGDWFHYLMKTCLITGAAMSFKRELLNDVDEIPEEWLHDGWLAFAAVTRKGLVPCNERLFLYRQHGNNEVGMGAVYDLGSRIKGWIKHFADVKQTRRIRYNRYSSLYRVFGMRYDKTQQKEIQACLSFWEDMIQSELMSTGEALQIYIKHYLKGNYSLFYNGFKGFVRDVLILLFY